jgi:hypothetical protein
MERRQREVALQEVPHLAGYGPSSCALRYLAERRIPGPSPEGPQRIVELRHRLDAQKL